MSRRRAALLLLLSTAAALLASRWVWSPLASAAPTAIPELAADLRTPAEHDARYGRAPYVVESAAGTGAAAVIGIRHTSDPDDPQIAELRRRFERFAPTLVLVEGRLGWHVGPAAGLIAAFGESGEAVALAHDRGIPVRSLEPELSAEVADARRAFGADRTLAFYALRVFVNERDRGDFGDGDLDAAMAALLAKRRSRTGLTESLPDVAALDAFWRRDGVIVDDWRRLPKEALWRTAGTEWTHRLAERINRFRDRAFVAAISGAVARGERVLAVCGSSHAILFEPALTAALAALDGGRPTVRAPEPTASSGAPGAARDGSDGSRTRR